MASTTNSNKTTYFLCDYCPYICLLKQQLSRHVDYVHPSKKACHVFRMQCPACNNVFFHIASLESHLKHDHLLPLEELKKIVHIVSSIGKPIQFSSTCNPANTSNQMTVTELTQATEIESGNSDVIIIENTNNNEADSQTSSNPDLPQKYRCNVGTCRETMQNITKLDYHKKCHRIDSNGFMCPECKKHILYWGDTQSHLWKWHKIDVEAFKCDICGYRTHSYNILMRKHMPKHQQDTQFQCEKCKRAFINQNQLKHHMRKTHREKNKGHNAVSALHCNECNKGFSRQKQFKIHMRVVHSQEEPFSCNAPNCTFTSANKIGLKMHMRLHDEESLDTCDCSKYDCNGDKPYCPLCDCETLQNSPVTPMHTEDLENDVVSQANKRLVTQECDYFQAPNVQISAEKPSQCDTCDCSKGGQNDDKPYCPQCDYESIQNSLCTPDPAPQSGYTGNNNLVPPKAFVSVRNIDQLRAPAKGVASFLDPPRITPERLLRCSSCGNSVTNQNGDKPYCLQCHYQSIQNSMFASLHAQQPVYTRNNSQQSLGWRSFLAPRQKF